MNRSVSGYAARLGGVVVATIAMSLGAAAQTWHASDGGPGIEFGFSGVKPLASGAGYISVGSTTSRMPGNTDIYVVESNLNGGVIWQFAYDIGGNEIGTDIVELAGGGFAITGSTTFGGAGGTTDAFILTINAVGGPIWLKTFGGAGNEVGSDIIQTANSDLVAAGYSTTPFGNQDGLLIRVPFTTACPAAPIFINTYAPPGGGVNDYFRSVCEATVGGPGVNVGDLIVGGGTNSFGGTTDAWLMRTTALGVPIWSNHTGGPGAAAENFNSVIELTVGAQAGNIVGAGGTTGILPSRLYVAKFAGPTGLQILPDIAGGPAGGFTEMFSVRENLAIAPGNLLLAGHTNPGALGGDDAYAVEMTPTWNCPLGKVFSMEYGSAGNEEFYSGSEANIGCFPGFIFCGYTTSPALLPAGDPQNMYLVKTNNVGTTGCFEIAPPDACSTPGYATVAVATPPMAQAWGVCRGLLSVQIPGNLVLCLVACPQNHERPAGNDGIAGVPFEEEGAQGANAFPNPVVAGNSFTVRYTIDMKSGGRVLVSDINGRVVYERKVEEQSGELAIGTSGWPAGTYLVKLGSGSESQTKRIVVIER